MSAITGAGVLDDARQEMNPIRFAVPMAMALSFLAAQAPGEEAKTIDVGDRLQLFADREIIDRMQGAELRLQAPVDQGIAMRFDQPWEGAFSGYCTVIKDGAKYLLY